MTEIIHVILYIFITRVAAARSKKFGLERKKNKIRRGSLAEIIELKYNLELLSLFLFLENIMILEVVVYVLS